jgi:ABC-type Na+ efflux pump permease subunit
LTALLQKDLRLLATWAWAIVPGHALFAVNGAFSPEFFFWVNVALAGAFTGVLLTIEWRLDADRFLNSLPVSRADVVKARYLAALGAALVATALYGLYGHALTAVGRGRVSRLWGVSTPGWESWEGLLALFLVVALLSFAFLPFHFRLGFGRGSAAFAAWAAPLASLGLLWLVREAAGTTRGGAIPLPAEALREGLERLSLSVGPGLAAAAALAAVVGVGAVSLRLSVASYEKRDL